MISRNKIMPIILLFFLINGTFTTALNHVSASELIEDSWNTKTPMNQARWGLGVIAVDDKIYAIGGYTAEGVVGTNERYDPKTDTWVTLKSMPTSRAAFGIVAYQGKIYCIGGQNSEGVCDVTEVYNTVTGSWSTKASMPFYGRDLRAHVINEKIYVMGDRDRNVRTEEDMYDFWKSIGQPYESGDTQDVYMYDPVADLWIKKTTMPDKSEPNVYLVSAVVDDKLMVTGRFPVVEHPNIRYEYRVMFYDPKSDVWSRGANGLGEVHVGVAGVTSGCYAPQRVYVLGLGVNYVYEPVNDAWTYGTVMPSARKSFGMAIVDDVLYVIGGFTSDDFSSLVSTTEPLSLNEQYIPADYTGNLPYMSYNPSNPFSSYRVVAALALTVGVIVTGLFLYIKKKEKRVKML